MGQARVALPFSDLREIKIILQDSISAARPEPAAVNVQDQGLLLDLPAWGYQVFSCHTKLAVKPVMLSVGARLAVPRRRLELRSYISSGRGEAHIFSTAALICCARQPKSVRPATPCFSRAAS